MIDSHCHLDFDVFDQDREQVLADARASGVTGFLLPGTQSKRFSRLQSLASSQPDIYYSLGFHPYFLDNSFDYCENSFREILTTHLDAKCAAKLVAIGEIGLDYVINISQDLQRDVFNMQLAMAKEFQLPVVLHHRKSHNDLIKLLKEAKFEYGGVVHAFSGSAYEAKSYVDLGIKLGVGGTITYERANKTKQALKNVGLDNLLLETDSPDMPLNGYQGRRNEPSRVVDVAAHLAALYECSVDEVARKTDDNFVKVFKVLPFCS